MASGKKKTEITNHQHDGGELNLALMDTAFDSVWVVDTNYCLQYGNQAFHNNFKLLAGKEIVNGESLLVREFDIELINTWQNYYNKVLNDGTSFSVEINSLVSGPGSFMQYSFSPVYFENKSIAGVLVIGRDITQIRQTEEALRKSEHHTKAIIEAIPDMIFRLDEEGVFRDYKADKKDMFVQPEMFLGKKFTELMPVWFAKLIKEKIATVLASNEMEIFEYQLPNAENEMLQFECRIFPFSGNEIIAIVRNINDKVEVEKKLRESEALARTIMESTDEPLFLIDKEGTVLDSNEAFAIKLDINRNELIGNNLMEILPTEITSKYKHLINFVVESARPYHGEDYRNGIWSEFSIYPVLLHDQTAGNFAIFLKDITKRKKAEQELVDANKFVTSLIQSMQDGFSVLDSNGVHIMVNKAFCKMTGYTSDELVGTGPPHAYWPPEYINEIETAFEETQHEEGRDFELVFRHKNGERFPVIVSSVIIRNEKGEAINYAATVKDIKERKRAEEALSISENKHRKLHESLRDGFVFVNMEGQILEFNDHYQKMLGYESEELHELTYIELTPAKWHDFEQDIVEKQILARGYSDVYVKDYIKKSGEVFPAEFRTVLIKNEEGENLGMWAIVRDVTERKETEDALRKSEKRLSELNATKDKFFSIIAHDLKSPFNSIIGFSEVLKNDARNIDINAIENYAAIINDSATQTLRLLENLLDWARMQQDKISFALKNLVLSETYKEVANLLAESAGRKNIELHNQIPDHIIVKADENMIKATMRNLISNAVKFTNPGGKVTISAKVINNEILVSVADTGIGISNENIEKLFDLQSNFTMRGTDREKGTGLGLMLCKEFVEKHGGRIWVESEEGKGSVFSFKIPVNNEPKYNIKK